MLETFPYSGRKFMFIAEDFKIQTAYLNIDSVAKSPDVIYIIDKNMVLKGYNEAWVNFAQNNNGKEILQRFELGTVMTKVGEEPIRSFLREAYLEALEENKPFEHTYECSSPDNYRLFRQTAYPLYGSTGLVISHHLVEEKPHEEEASEFSKQFTDEHGIVTQCQNCRKIRNPENRRSWFWVPALVRTPLPEISHGICSTCLDHYYPDIDD